MNPVELIKEDWRRLSPGVRFLNYIGVSLLFIDWVTDNHWNVKYTLFGWNYHKSFFSFGVLFILAGFLLIVLKQFNSVSMLAYYRNHYEINKVNVDFSLGNFKGRMYLFDKRTKEAFHVETSNTASDLGFWGEDIYMDMSYAKAVSEQILLPSPANLKVSDYSYSGTIKTRD